ncbi:hypothetical protein MANES_05G008900v8 [Manihot esculenta]|uniref:Uncharacterized protein n=1 Tax=Manihot esculenta TaxID=3983 RepID=A0ACB7HKW3_MANES|nr:hypothetical protein MANES_05G008900v8 [Manihot esculenta]
MGNKNRASKNAKDASKSGFVPQEQDCYEGERLVRLLKLINGAIESAKLLDGNSLPEKFWFKQRFAIGVNEVTRVLERMSPTVEMEGFGQKPPPHVISTQHRKPTAVQLQAIVIAHDCNPKWLMKHLPSLASSRKVPVIFVKDGKKGSLRLGELVKLKTAIAIGVKVKDHDFHNVNLHISCI